ncbi:serine hydrolase domain-containing protein [Methanonatronarchaeum sp. AMET-Sl]|uniref:serine hydrolase domain-containing protein n=1 Tax=Methanonatronarchaeum sp. AMET-Sl TaxID=3037654 RepID=UPI00244DA497|nr:serine hydrolase domain-containing protein [Methanonatronarchaeum sp. AMET-Sl]WGI18011.1 serine hydrolase [Methanonatronarchaeum sp. AMET-Sl]
MDLDEFDEVSRRRFLRLSGFGVGGFYGGFGGSGSSFRSFVDNRVPGLLDRYGIPGAGVAVVSDGEVVWSSYFGVQERDGRSVDSDTLFRVQSISKSLTAWGVLSLVEQGLVDLDSSIERYITSLELSESEWGWSQVTVRRLLSHSAGLPTVVYDNYGLDEEVPSLREVVLGVGDMPSVSPVEEVGGFKYSNPGFLLLEVLIEDVTGRDFKEFMKTEILVPLGMYDSCFGLDDVDLEKVAREHRVDGSKTQFYREPGNAHSMLLSTLDDVARFVAAGSTGGGVLTNESISLMYSGEVETKGFYNVVFDKAGLGHFIDISGNSKSIGHGGQGTGSWSWYQLVPNSGDGVVILTNSERSLEFIGKVIDEWAVYNDFDIALSSVLKLLKIPIWFFGILSGILVFLLSYDGFKGKRSFDPEYKVNSKKRISVTASVATILLIWWIWIRSSIGDFLPISSELMSLTLTLFCILVLVWMLFPKK